MGVSCLHCDASRKLKIIDFVILPALVHSQLCRSAFRARVIALTNLGDNDHVP